MKTRIYFLVLISSICIMPALAVAQYGGHGGTYSYGSYSQPTGQPVIALGQVQSVGDTRAVVGVYFNSNNAQYSWNYSPRVYVQYANTQTGQTFTTRMDSQVFGTRVIPFALINLQPGTTYSYTGAMQYRGITTYTNTSYFTTTNVGGAVVNSDSYSNSYGGSIVVKPAPVVIYNPVASTNSEGDSKTGFFAKIKEKAEESVATGGTASKDGVILAISDTSARVNQGDVLEYKIQYRNTNAKSLQDAKIVVNLPPQYQFLQSSYAAEVNDDENTVTFTLGRVPAKETKTITFTVKAIGEESGELQTVATMSYDGGSLEVADRDLYRGGSQALGGAASLFGARFFPQTFLGWFLIILLLGLVVILARRYIKNRERAKLEKHRTTFESKEPTQ